ncbi:MAG: hypothetical protein F4Y49_15475 [Dehalococcoidia bacterium]|nr:hypothetical protein [Dehalococcoidia bacterium]
MNNFPPRTSWRTCAAERTTVASSSLERTTIRSRTRIEYINPDLIGYAAEIGIAMLDFLAVEAEK